MVGNGSWGFPDRDVFDRGRKVTRVFLKWPRKTNRGWRWLIHVNRVSVIQIVPPGKFMSFIGLGFGADIEVITYEVL
jgi:hypothetical protein